MGWASRTKLACIDRCGRVQKDSTQYVTGAHTHKGKRAPRRTAGGRRKRSSVGGRLGQSLLRVWAGCSVGETAACAEPSGLCCPRVVPLAVMRGPVLLVCWPPRGLDAALLRSSAIRGRCQSLPPRRAKRPRSHVISFSRKAASETGHGVAQRGVSSSHTRPQPRSHSRGGFSRTGWKRHVNAPGRCGRISFTDCAGAPGEVVDACLPNAEGAPGEDCASCHPTAAAGEQTRHAPCSAGLRLAIGAPAQPQTTISPIAPRRTRPSIAARNGPPSSHRTGGVQGVCESCAESNGQDVLRKPLHSGKIAPSSPCPHRGATRKTHHPQCLMLPTSTEARLRTASPMP